jgi:hypothetical protein
LTLEGAAFLAGAFLVANFCAAFLAFVGRFAGTVFFAGRPLAAVFFATDLLAAALLAFGLVADFAFTARFAVLADVLFAEDREVDRRKPFVRLLLMKFNLKKAAQEV